MILPRRRSEPWAAGESACRPGSVHPLARAGDHPSGTAVAGSLVRSTREHRAGHPQTFAHEAGASLLTLLRVGFTEPPGSLRALVVSYTTVSPLPRDTVPGRSVFCGTFPRVAPGRRYRPPCPAEPGPSSPGGQPGATARSARPPRGHDMPSRGRSRVPWALRSPGTAAPRGHSPESGVRTRIRRHSSQRSTSSSSAARMRFRSTVFRVRWQPSHRPPRRAAAPTPCWTRIRS